MNEQTDIEVTTRNVQFLLILAFDKSGTMPALAVGINFASVCGCVHLFLKHMVCDKVIYLYGCLYVI